jgi:hypothetical protein
MLGFYSIVLTLYLFIAFVELKPILKKTLHFNLLTSSLRSPCVSVCPTKSHHDLQNKDSVKVFQENTIQEETIEENFNVEDVFQESTIQQLKNSTQFYVKKVCGSHNFYLVSYMSQWLEMQGGLWGFGKILF